jgi:hypothetical protein
MYPFLSVPQQTWAPLLTRSNPQAETLWILHRLLAVLNETLSNLWPLNDPSLLYLMTELGMGREEITRLNEDQMIARRTLEVFRGGTKA